MVDAVANKRNDKIEFDSQSEQADKALLEKYKARVNRAKFYFLVYPIHSKTSNSPQIFKQQQNYPCS